MRARPAPLHPGDVVELAVLEVTPTDIGCRRLDDGSRITFRGVDGVFLVPGHLAEVRVKRCWRFGRPYLSGAVVRSTVDVARLGLEPLKLTPVEFTPEGPPVSRQAFALEDPVPGRGRRRDPLAEAERAVLTGMPWTFAGNRPFLRCLAGLAHAPVKASERAASRAALERLLRLAPDAPAEVRALPRAV